MKLVEIVQQDVHQFLTKNQELMFNERDFQMHLAVFLRETRKYDDVDVEYYVPYKALNNYIWESELRLDILVRKGNEYLPVELKYKTKRVTKGILRFETSRMSRRTARWFRHATISRPRNGRDARCPSEGENEIIWYHISAPR